MTEQPKAKAFTSKTPRFAVAKINRDTGTLVEYVAYFDGPYYAGLMKIALERSLYNSDVYFEVRDRSF